jgi:hypothetical protein
MIKLETHAHCQELSFCAHADVDRLIKDYITAGYGAIVLTNHYCKRFFELYKGETKKEKLDFYFKVYDEFSEKCKKANIKAFLGTEIMAYSPSGERYEFTYYGFDRSLFYDNKPLYELTQKELFYLAEKNNVFMYQTHPARRGVATGNGEYLHGAESFNGHVLHLNNNALANEFCDKYNLIKLSGTDYHDPDQPILGGIYLPENINTDEQLKEYIFKGNLKLIEDEKTYQKLLNCID